MMITVVPGGWLADRVPRRRVLAAGLALQALAALPLLALPPSLAGVLTGTALTGAGLGLMLVSFNSYVADLLHASQVTPAFGLASAASVLGSAAGPFLAAALLRGGLRLAAAPFAILPLAAALAALRLPTARVPPAPEPPPDAPARVVARNDSEGQDASLGRVVAPIMAMYVVLGAGYGMTAPYFTTYFLDTVGLSEVAWGIVLALATAASAVGALVMGRLARRHERGPRVVLASQALLALACVAFLLPLGALALSLAVVARYAFSSGVAPVVNARLARSVRFSSRAQAQGYGSLAWNAGWATGGAAGGALLATLGGALFPFGAALGLAGVLMGLALLRR
jgi:MFS family permease